MVEVTSPSEPRDSIAGTVVPGVAMIAVTFGLARYGYGLLLPEMQADLAVSPAAAGLISSTAYVSYLAANVAVVWLTTRFEPRCPIGLAAALAAVGMTEIATSSRTVALALGVLVAGAAAGLAFPPYADIVAHRVPRPRRALAWSAISSGTGWGVAIAGPIAIGFGDRWRLAWLVFVVLAVAAGIVATLRAPARSTAPQHLPQLSWTWFVCPRSRPLLLSSVLVGAGSSVWWAFSVDGLRHAGIAATDARIVYAVCGAAGVLASLSGAVIDRIGLRRSYLIACMLLSAALLLLGFGAGRMPVAVLAAVLFGMFYNAVIATQGVWSSRVFAERPSAGLAAVNTALTLGTVIGPTVAGAAIHRSGFTATLIGAAVVIVPAVFFCPPTARRRELLAAHHCAATAYAQVGAEAADTSAC